MAARRIGLSYVRYSDPTRQADGTSIERQEKMYRDFCKLHNLTPLQKTHADRGRSAYHGKNVDGGELGELIRDAEDGRFEPGTVLVIEAWDRFTRLRADKATALIADLLQTGIDIGICRLNDIFTEADFGSFKWATLSTFIMLAHQESKQKAERVSAAWAKRREVARDTKDFVTARWPAWLELVDGELHPVPERSAAVRRVFALAGLGLGRTRIINALAKEGVSAFGHTGTWTASYIGKILNDRRALGTYQPRKTDDTPDGPPIEDYYPAIITEDEWLLSRAGQEKRQQRDRRGHLLVRTERKYANTFRGLLVVAGTDSGFQMHEKVEGDKRRFVLQARASRDSKAKVVTFPYHVFETAILARLKEVDPTSILPQKGVALSRTDTLRARLKEIRDDLAGLQEELRERFSKGVAAVLRQKEEEEERVVEELQDELAKAVVPLERDWSAVPSLVEQIAKGGDPARLRLRQVLRRVLEGGHVLIVRRKSFLVCAVQLDFTGGGRRIYVFAYQSAGRHRPVRTWPPLSLADAAALGKLDLRNRDHAERLEKELLTLDLAKLAPSP